MSAAATVERLRDAICAHDLDAIVDCYAEDVRSEQPAHPARDFRGREQIRENWRQILRGVPDISASLERCVVDGDLAVAEWSWRGIRGDGAPFALAGVTLQRVAAGRIVWVRLYMEPVERSGDDAGTAIRRGLS